MPNPKRYDRLSIRVHTLAVVAEGPRGVMAAVVIASVAAIASLIQRC